MTALSALTIAEARRALRAGEIGAIELTEACLEAAAGAGALNAVSALTPDRARYQASLAAARLAEGDAPDLCGTLEPPAPIDPRNLASDIGLNPQVCARSTYDGVIECRVSLQPELTIAFPQPVPFNGLVLMPRQNHREHEGDVREWLIQVSDDGQAWRDVKRATLGSTFDPQTVAFDGGVTARYLKLTSLSGFGNDRASALADVAVLYTGPALAEEAGDVEYKRSKSASVDVDEAGMEDKRPTKGQKKR